MSTEIKNQEIELKDEKRSDLQDVEINTKNNEGSKNNIDTGRPLATEEAALTDPRKAF